MSPKTDCCLQTISNFIQTYNSFMLVQCTAQWETKCVAAVKLYRFSIIHDLCEDRAT